MIVTSVILLGLDLLVDFQLAHEEAVSDVLAVQAERDVPVA